MEIRKNQVGKTTYTFVCETWENSRAWGHKVTMFRNDYEMLSNKIRYYNRTWEMYRYQSCMQGAVRKAIEEYKETALNSYRYKNNVTKIKQDLKDKIYAENEIIQELEQLYKEI